MTKEEAQQMINEVDTNGNKKGQCGRGVADEVDKQNVNTQEIQRTNNNGIPFNTSPSMMHREG